VTGLPLLVALVHAAAGGQDPAQAAPVRVSYRALATLDEPAHALRGTLEIVVSPAAGEAVTSIALATGFAHVGAVRVDGVAVFGSAKDGRGLRIPLPTPRTAGDSLLISAEFVSDAVPPAGGSPSGGRHFDFRAWLPRVADAGAWSRAVPGSFLVTLDVPADQVVAATGVPLCGDPGWAGARWPPGRPVTLRGGAYPAPRDAAADSVASEFCRAPQEGRKRVVWYAEDVRDVALVMDPDFTYEEGDFLDRPVRVLYLPGDERTWGAGFAVRRSETALAWLHDLYDAAEPGGYPWPQTTVVHAVGGAGHADPMLVSAGAPDQETILREVGRLYVTAASAVAPADEAWLGRGLARFQTDLYFETQGRRRTYRQLERAVLHEELDGRAKPVLPEGEAASGSDSAAARRAEFLLYQLRAAAGDSVMGSILSAFWARARLRSADESLFVAVADAAAPGDFGERFAASLRDATLVDYAIGMARREAQADGRWRTTVEVRRLGGGHFPFTVRVMADGDAGEARAAGVAQRETVTVETATRPVRVVLDPAGTTHDWNVLNNQRTFGFRLGRDAPASDFLDPFFTRPSRRDRLARSWAPVAWYNGAGGWTLGARRRDDYLGFFELNELWMSFATGIRARRPQRNLDAGVVLANPTWLRSPGLGERLELAKLEGRTVAGVSLEKARGLGTTGVSLAWVGATTAAYLDPTRYERAGTLELTATGSLGWSGPAMRARAAAALAAGYASWRRSAQRPGDGEPYARVTALATVDHALGAVHLRARASAGAALTRGHLLRQRRIYLAGADPYELLTSPFLRSRGALLVRDGMHYHAPGGAGLRGLSPALSARQAYGLSLEIERDLMRRSGGLATRLAVAAFGDGAIADGDLDPGDRLAAAGDAGIGVRIDHHIGTTSFQTRFDFPVWVSVPRLAQDTGPGRRRFGFRWMLSFTPAF
jgi:hypothetical protein